MNGPAIVAEHLDDRTDALISAWRLSLRRSGDVPQADALTWKEFEDHIPSLIDRMVERLRGNSSDVSDPAEKHGRMRWNQGYGITELVAEYGHLRTTLVRTTFDCARENEFDHEVLEDSLATIDEIINEAINESVRQFHEDSQAQARSARSGLEEHGRVVAIERAKLGALLDSLPVGAWVADSDGMIIGLNAVAESLQEFPASESLNRLNILVSTPIFLFTRTDGTTYLPSEFPLARAIHGESIHDEEMCWIQPSGIRHILASATPLRGPNEVLAGAVVVVKDISERKRLESALVRMTSQLSGIIEQSPVMIWRTDAAGRSDFTNRTFTEYFGLSAEEASTGAWLNRIHPEDRAEVMARFDEALEARAVFSTEFRVYRRDGNYRWFSARAVPLNDEKGVFLGYIGTATDVNDQHELEAALHRQREIAEQSSLHKSRLMAALSHDARTPLNAVVLAAQLLEMHIEEAGDPEVTECLRTIRNGVRNVLDLLGDLLDLTRIDAGAMPAEPTVFSLDSALAECLSSIETPARLKGLDCRMELDGLVGLTVETDRAKLKQIISNFLSNSLRYTLQGRIRLYGEREGDQIRISVEDTGVGIAPADQIRVFDEFATLEGRKRAKDGGTGLGLAICRRLAILLGGEILIDSALGEGSTFTLVLPASIATTEIAPKSLSSSPSGAQTEAPILVAEDHNDSRQMLGRLLRRMGYRVLEAADGSEAMEMARNERPLAILMDINMPGMDGIEATLAIRADSLLNDLPIFALTGDVSAENQERIGEAGVQGYLKKPVTTEAIRNALDTLKSS